MTFNSFNRNNKFYVLSNKYYFVEKLLKRLIASIEFNNHILFSRNFTYRLLHTIQTHRNFGNKKNLYINLQLFLSYIICRENKISPSIFSIASSNQLQYCIMLKVKSLKFNFITLFNFLLNIWKFNVNSNLILKYFIRATKSRGSFIQKKFIIPLKYLKNTSTKPKVTKLLHNSINSITV